MIGNIELDSDKLANVMKVSVLIDDDHTVLLTPIPFQLWLDNQSRMVSLTSVFKRFNLALSGLYSAFLGQTLTQARFNVVASYDQSNELFKVCASWCLTLLGVDWWHFCQAFLSKEMMYSCALWSDKEGGVDGDLLSRPGDHSTDLEMAQLRKIHYVLRKARVKRGHRILEIGSGWGGLAIEVCQNYPSWGHKVDSFSSNQAARTFGCEVDTLTLSVEQKKLAEERIREAGLEHLVRVHLMDYRQIPPDFEKQFDAFVSIEMVEVNFYGCIK
jgi:cyclopropane-fatty-acyl-phospholipid synthase